MVFKNWADDVTTKIESWLLFESLFKSFYHSKVTLYCVRIPCLCRGTTDVCVESFRIRGRMQLHILFNQNIAFPHIAAISFSFLKQ